MGPGAHVGGAPELRRPGAAAPRPGAPILAARATEQRLAIERALLHDPQVLLLDEPYTELDQDASSMLDDVLRRVASPAGPW